MTADIFISAPVASDPDLTKGGVLTLERADGRSVWRQRLVVRDKIETDGKVCYIMDPTDA